jgi:outer membrane protein TolC
MYNLNPLKMKQLRIRKTIFLLLFCINFLLNGQAQEVYDLSNCISKGLERNFSLQVIRNREQVAGNNYTRGNAGFLPTVTTTNRIGGTVISTNQSLRDGTSSESKGIHNISGSAGVTLAMTVFKGFSIQTTYQKLSELKRIGELSTQVSVENLIGNIAAEYNYYIQQQTLYNNLKYAVSLSRERVRIDEQRYILGASSKLQLLQSKVYLNADSSRLA